MVAAVSTMPSPKGDAMKKAARPPLLPNSEAADNGVFGNRRLKSREVTSRYMFSKTSSSTTSGSATSSSSSNSSYSNASTLKRYPSPIVSKTVPSTPMPGSTTVAVKRSQSVERRWPGTPRPYTPGNSAAANLLITSKRSLSVSLQGDTFSLPISKTKTTPLPSPVMNSLSCARKGTPTPVRDRTENSKPIDQHRWPGRSREVNSVTRSLDTVTKKQLGGSESVVRSLHQSMIVDGSKALLDGILKTQSNNTKFGANSAAASTSSFDRVASDAESISSRTSEVVPDSAVVSQMQGGSRGIVVPARFWQETTNRVRRLQEPKSPGSLKPGAPSKLNTVKKSFVDSSPRGVSSGRGLSSPTRGAVRPASPNKLGPSLAFSLSRGMLSPSRVRNDAAPLTLSNDFSRTPSILSFAAQTKGGKVGENRVVDAHLLRLLHNRHLQWRFINARADAATLVQKVTAEKSLYNAWVTTAKLWHSVKMKRLELQLLHRSLKLHSILKGQMVYLDDWDLIDLDHSSSLSGATEAFEASTVRLPVGGGARVDVQNMKDAICSAVDVMQGMASSICYLLTKADQVNSVASELAIISAQERALLDQCKDLLSTLTAMQVKDCSLRTHILQLTNVPSSLTTKVQRC